MAITASAKKAIRSARRRRVFNVRRQSAMRDSIKEMRQLVAAGDRAAATKLLPSVYSAIDKAAKRGVIKPNAASRRKSRLASLIGRLV